jgi:hypothetical protein
MPSPSQPEEDVSESTSPRPTLLPSPFTHSGEEIETSPSLRGDRRLPRPVQATSASIYEGDATVLGRHGQGQSAGVKEVGDDGKEGDGLGEEEEQGVKDGDDYPAQHDEAGSLLPPENFHPFFTLITDATTGETYHPSTYYVFSDDDPDVLTTASLHALDSYSPQATGSPSQATHSSNLREGAAEGDEVTDSERYIIVDLAPSGTQIHAAKSLSPEWAITGADIRGAPTFQASEDTEGPGGGEGLMLVLEGMGIQGPPTTVTDDAARTKKSKELLDEARKRGGGSLVQGMEELRLGLCGGLGVLDKIVGLDE